MISNGPKCFSIKTGIPSGPIAFDGLFDYEMDLVEVKYRTLRILVVFPECFGELRVEKFDMILWFFYVVALKSDHVVGFYFHGACQAFDKFEDAEIYCSTVPRPNQSYQPENK